MNQNRVSLRASAPDAPETQSPFRVGGAMLSIVAALALVLMPVEAQAAKSGGRIGGTATSARSKAPPRPAPKAPAATSTNKTTVINQTTVIAPPPPVVAAPPMGMGMGMGVGLAPAPVVVAPAPSLGDVVVGTVIGGAINNAITGGHHSGPSTADRMLENQQRQDERQIDNQKAEIEQLKAEINNMKAAK